jgi:hypothetical protein
MTLVFGLLCLLLPLAAFGSLVTLLRIADVVRRQRETLAGVRK